MGRQRLDKREWILFRVKLNNSYKYNKQWETVITMFRQRVTDFYLNPIDSLLEVNWQKGEGFSILTLQCALIEMLAAFKAGKIHKHRKETGDPKYVYSSSSYCFIDFLQTEDIFENHFYTINDRGKKLIKAPYDAGEFYDRVRCGLMHEARTKVDWLITSKVTDAYHSSLFITRNPDGTKSVNRTILQLKLKYYFEEKYIEKLKGENKDGEKLRRFLARKLDHLYDIPRDNVYEWWKDL